jgi:hypothetical protein
MNVLAKASSKLLLCSARNSQVLNPYWLLSVDGRVMMNDRYF